MDSEWGTCECCGKERGLGRTYLNIHLFDIINLFFNFKYWTWDGNC